MMRGMILAAALLTAAAAGGCFAEADVGATASYDAQVTGPAPDLVEVEPGVQVVADYDEPVFYSDGFYWRYYNNIWYRSSNYASGWVYYDRPPVAVLRIERPYAYRHYRPTGYVVRSRPRYRPSPVREYRGPAPAYRRERVERREDRREERREERHDRREERREERHDRREDRREDRRDDRRDRH